MKQQTLTIYKKKKTKHVMHFFSQKAYLTVVCVCQVYPLFNNLVFFQGTLQDGQVVAIKVFQNSDGLWSDTEMARELRIISKVEHRNIVKMSGICTRSPRDGSRDGS